MPDLACFYPSWSTKSALHRRGTGSTHLPLLRSRSSTNWKKEPSAFRSRVIIGYGLSGQLLAASLRSLSIEVIVLEMNADNAAKGKDRDDPVYYADATSEEALGHAHAESARAAVVMINDHKAAERVLATINRLDQDTRFRPVPICF